MTKKLSSAKVKATKSFKRTYDILKMKNDLYFKKNSNDVYFK